MSSKVRPISPHLLEIFHRNVVELLGRLTTFRTPRLLLVVDPGLPFSLLLGEDRERPVDDRNPDVLKDGRQSSKTEIEVEGELVGGRCREEGDEELREAKVVFYLSLRRCSRPDRKVRDVRETAACTKDPRGAGMC